MTREERKNFKAMLKEIGTQETFRKAFEYEGYRMGCYDNKINDLNFENLCLLIEELDMNESGEMMITHNRVKYVIEYDTVDQERDINIKTAKEYKDQYGREFGDEWM